MRRTLEDAALRWVDQIFTLLRQATLGELAELLAARETAKARRPAAGDRRRRRAPSRSPRRSTVRYEPELRDDPAEEITDPGALLEAVATVGASTGKATEPEPRAVPAAPESAKRLVTTEPATPATASLRDGETIARASGAGLVIRRRRGEPAADEPVVAASETKLVDDAPPSSPAAETLTELAPTMHAVAVS